ncbi:MAG: hypothetical protein H0S80_04090 [Desulfovibrionaceae bacterium]|nr:hypothetical protein [Desulfovibrionaceae bacterium]
MRKAISMTLVFCLLLPAISYGKMTDDEVVESAESVVSIWQSELDRGLDILFHHTEYNEYFCVRTFQGGAVSYDVRKTDSLVSPYKLIIVLSTFFKDNTKSPRADGPEFQGIHYGFKTADQAVQADTSADFSPISPIELKGMYAFQGGQWVLKAGDTNFKGNFLMKPKTVNFPTKLLNIKAE